MTIKIEVLGCGAAAGVPMVSKGWGKCNPDNPKNYRTRSSIYLNVNSTGILIDTSPDLRTQLLQAKTFQTIDGVLFTHLHADHTDGVNELREINRINNCSLPIFSDIETIKSIKERFWYAFDNINLDKEPLYHVLLTENIIEPYKSFNFKGVNILPLLQDHGYMNSLGFRIGDFAYSTDVVRMPDATINALKGIKVWIVGCLDFGQHPTHAGVEQVLEWVNIIKPEKVYLTHMSIGMDYDYLCNFLPENIRPAYDGMSLEL
jgi:phosphoribosyl 1,2-cyclic phosphate phosphodiesterase